jgi:hypothetical protein
MRRRASGLHHLSPKTPEGCEKVVRGFAQSSSLLASSCFGVSACPTASFVLIGLWSDSITRWIELPGPSPSIDVADALLDERLRPDRLNYNPQGNFSNSRCE